MSTVPRLRPTSVDDYLAAECLAERKHEYVVYVLLEQESAAAVVYRRGDGGFAREVCVGVDATIPLPEVACELRLADVYENVGLAP